MKFHKGYQYIVLCEDTQTESYIKHVLKDQGIDTRKIRIEKAASGKGSAEAFVRREYPRRLQAMRSLNYNRNALIVCIDADTGTTEERKSTLARSCKDREAPIPNRGDKEAVMIWVPKRNIETWIRFFRLDGKDTNETSDYRHNQPMSCKAEAHAMSDYLQGKTESADVLLSLIDAKAEFEQLCRVQS